MQTKQKPLGRQQLPGSTELPSTPAHLQVCKLWFALGAMVIDFFKNKNKNVRYGTVPVTFRRRPYPAPHRGGAVAMGARPVLIHRARP